MKKTITRLRKKLSKESDFYNFIRENYVVFFLSTSLFLKTLAINRIGGVLFWRLDILRLFSIGFLVSFLIFGACLFLPRVIKNRLALTISLLMSLLAMVDVLYLRYFKDIPSVGLLGGAGQIKDVLPALFMLFRATDLFIFVDLVVAWYLIKISYKKDESSGLTSRSRLNYASGVVFGVISILTLLFYFDYPIFFKRALTNVYSNKITAEKYGFLAAHVIDAYRVFSDKLKKLSPQEEKDTLDFIKKNAHRPKNNEKTESAQGKNIILIQVESLSAEVLDKSLESQEITPNLNRFSKEAYNFKNHFFQAGGGNTSDVDFSVNTSLYPIENEAVFIKYGQNNFTSFPKELKKAGYSTYAYHGYYAGFWNRQVALRSLGYEKFMAAESYPNDYVVNMGLNDETFFRYTLEYVKNQPKPSLSYIITLSNHAPFWLQHDKRLLKLDEAKYPGSVHGYLQTVRYTDEQIGKFLSGLKESNLYDDSLIIIYGDHLPHIDYYRSSDGEFESSLEKLRKVPLLIKLPNQERGEKIETSSSHLDIAPTVLNLVGVRSTIPMLGRDLFSNDQVRFGLMSFFEGSTFYKGDHLFYDLNDGREFCGRRFQGHYEKVDNHFCQDFAKEQRDLIENSKKLIRYDLFRYWQKK